MRRASAAFLALAAAACASGPPEREAAGGAPVVAGLPFQELPPQDLAAGQCALALWSRSDGRRIAMAAGNGLRARIGGRIQTLERTRWEGLVTLQHAQRQEYRGDVGEVALELVFDSARTTATGAVVEGTLTFRDPSGWTLLTPVAGLVGCEP